MGEIRKYRLKEENSPTEENSLDLPAVGKLYSVKFKKEKNKTKVRLGSSRKIFLVSADGWQPVVDIEYRVRLKKMASSGNHLDYFGLWTAVPIDEAADRLQGLRKKQQEIFEKMRQEGELKNESE